MIPYTIPDLYTIPAFLKYSCQDTGNALAFQYRSGEDAIADISREQFYEECFRAAAVLKKLPEEKVAIYGDNCYFWIAAFFALCVSGKTAVLLDRGAAPAENAQMLETAQCSFVLHTDAFTSLAQQVQQLSGAELLSLNTLFAEAQAASPMEPDADISKNTLAAILFTSGTTGKRKAVPLTHGNIITDVVNVARYVEGQGKVIATLPLHHCFGIFVTILLPLIKGCTIFINDSLRRLPLDIKYCQTYLLPTVPAISEMLARVARADKDPARLRAFLGSNFRCICSGGGPISKRTRDLYEGIGVHIIDGYGITECASLVAFNTDSALYGESLGKAIGCCEIRLSDEGEILVRGENVMSGYYNAPEENEKAFLDGWFRTGDLGEFGPNGELTITGRLKKLIILSNGENIPSEPLEALLYQLPYVREALVYGLDDHITAEIFPEPEAGDIADRFKADVDAINRTLPLDRCITSLRIRTTEFPKTSSGKIRL